MSAFASNNNLVEFKAIGDYANTCNSLQYHQFANSEAWAYMKKLLEPFRVPKGSTEDVNVINPRIGRFKLKSVRELDRFFDALKKCHEDKLVANFEEKQTSDEETGEGSGIMIDLDIERTMIESIEDDANREPAPVLELLNPANIASIVFGQLQTMIDFDDSDQIYIAITAKPKPIYDENKKCWKDGLHILVPSVKLTRKQKKLFLDELAKNKKFNKRTRAVLNMSAADIVDKNAAHVPVYFVHNCKPSSDVAYTVAKVFYCDDATDDFIDDITDSFVKEDMARELSLSFDGKLVTKKNYRFNDEFQSRINTTQTHSNTMEEIRERSMSTFHTMNVDCSENMEYYMTLVMEVLDVKRARNYLDWQKVVFTLSNINPKNNDVFKEIARQFSLRCEEKYDNDAFEKLWQRACEPHEGPKYNCGTLINMCKEDNKTMFDSILVKDIKQIIESDVYGGVHKIINGELFHYHFATYIYHIFRHKFAYDIDDTGKIEKWYEFVVDTDPCKEGEIYKWRPECRPESISSYLSDRFPKILSDVVARINTFLETIDDEEKAKAMAKRRDLFVRSSRGVFTNPFKVGVIREAQAMFRRRGFMDTLDKAPNTMGVANGVLELEPTGVRLLTGYHDYAVSMYTDISYREYDPTNEKTQYLLKILLAMFPDNERDAFHKMMYIFATSLDGRPKDSSFWQFVGAGCNGKSSLMELLKNVLGKYGGKVNVSVLTEDRSKSGGANEQMMAYKTARLAFYSETNKAETINCATVKELTSQESITNRGIYEKQSTFRPNTNHIITTNYPMTIKTTDYGIWRRMNLYEFKIKFKVNPDPEDEFERLLDPKVAKALSQDRDIKEAMLSILVEYYKDLYANHGGELSNIYSPTIDRETFDYRNQQDTLNRFLHERVVSSLGVSTTMLDFVDEYIKWVEANVSKSAAADENEVRAQVSNSLLGKRIKKVNHAEVLTDIRVLQSIDGKIEDHEYIITEERKKNGDVKVEEYVESKFNPLHL